MARRTRTEEFGVAFTGPDETAEGWHFPVPALFRPMLDIQRVERKRDGRMVMVWSRGEPPSLSFAAGHMLYDPECVRRLPWDEGRRLLRRQIHILDAMPDSFGPDNAGGRPAVRGWVAFQLTMWRGGEIVEQQDIEMMQQGFADYLRTGVLDEGQFVHRLALASPPEKRQALLHVAVEDDGVEEVMRVDLRHLDIFGDSAYLRVVRQESGAARVIPVDHIRRACDLDSGTVIARNDVLGWLRGSPCDGVRLPLQERLAPLRDDLLVLSQLQPDRRAAGGRPWEILAQYAARFVGLVEADEMKQVAELLRESDHPEDRLSPVIRRTRTWPIARRLGLYEAAAALVGPEARRNRDTRATLKRLTQTRHGDYALPPHLVAEIEAACGMAFAQDDQRLAEPWRAPLRPPADPARTVILLYRGGDGRVTQRQVTPLALDDEGDKTILTAHCHHRGAVRSFRLDRIEEMYRGDDGEEIAQAGWQNHLLGLIGGGMA